MDTEYSKRVYQGVRVKHTVKDLLAEKRSRYPPGPRSNGVPATQPSIVQMQGSHTLPSYYGMRRSFISDGDYCSSAKQFPSSSDIYSSGLGGKPLTCDPSSMSTYPSLMDSYYPETFGDYRSAAAFSNGAGSIFHSSALSSLLPPYPSDSSHFLLRDSWEQSVPDPVSQVEGLCAPDSSLSSVPVPVSMPSPEPPQPPGSPSAQYHRSSSPDHSVSMVPSSSYSLHSLEELHSSAASSYHALASGPYPTAASFSCHPPYMTSGASIELASKMEEAGGHGPLPTHGEVHSSWSKEDGGSPWAPYEIRRSY
ncbi:POU class 2 homeobox associating-factor 2-like [Aplochiton taeniatus]